jgi:hypothetical protein
MGKKLTKKRKNLLKELADIMSTCYNPHSTTALGWGAHYDYGKEFNYPIKYLKDGKEVRYAEEVYSKNPKEEILMSGRCNFGANKMYIYDNLEKVLRKLEEEYDVDFSK